MMDVHGYGAEGFAVLIEIAAAFVVGVILILVLGIAVVRSVLHQRAVTPRQGQRAENSLDSDTAPP
jgi:hypothetical protein